MKTVLALFVLLTTVPASGQETPDWMTIDSDAKTVLLDIVAGKTDANNNWNFNGLVGGEATVVIPKGYSVTLKFTNDDPNMAHSIGVGQKSDTFPAMFDNPKPVFEGAMSSNPTDMMNATPSGKTETLNFVASSAGEYALICYIPAHASVGMWLGLTVSDDGSSGLVTP